MPAAVLKTPWILYLITGWRTCKFSEIWVFCWSSGISFRLLQVRFSDYCWRCRTKCSKTERSSFFVWLKERSLNWVSLIIGDKNSVTLETIPEVFPDAHYQRCIVHFYRNIFSVTPRNKMKTLAMMLKAIRAHESKKRHVRKLAE